MDNQLLAVQGYPKPKEDPLVLQRHERMKAQFERIEARNKQTEEYKKKKEEIM